ncbi:MAG: hypothetical protein MK291_11010 [Planctomycetes bacterium]|nr:hypothetical protein [Planctomycetota bacterium]
MILELIILSGLLSESHDHEEIKADRPVHLGQVQWTPSAAGCYVRGTVPVPPDFNLEPGRLAFFEVLRDELTHVQVEPVTYSPSGKVEVIEVLSNKQMSGRWTDLVSTSPVRLPQPISAAHARISEPVRLRATDAKGEIYIAELQPGGAGHQAIKTLKAGHVHRQDRHAIVMMPEDPEEALHPRLFGAHAYFGSWSEDEYLTLDLRVHNALVSPDANPAPTEDAIGPLYFESLELVLPEGWGAIPLISDSSQGPLTPRDGEVSFPIVSAQPEGKLHMMPPGARLQRRLALFPTGEPATRQKAHDHLQGYGAAACIPSEDSWSWSNPKTAHYFSHRQQLPTLKRLWDHPREPGLRMLNWEPLPVAAHMSAGDGGVGLLSSPALGWAHPWFRPSAGGHGGEGITFLTGLRFISLHANRNELLNLMLLHRANSSRQATGSWRANGEPTRIEEWTQEGALPFRYHLVTRSELTPLRLSGDGGPVPSRALREHLTQERRPPYDQEYTWKKDAKRPTSRGELLSWQPHDGAHLIRYTAHAKALAWLANDSLAKDNLRHCAERILFALPTVKSQAPPMTSVRQLLDYATEAPEMGLPVGRELGWALDTVAAAHSLSEGNDHTDPWWTDRQRYEEWLLAACQAVTRATPSTGVVIRDTTSARPANRTHATAHSFQVAILQLGLRSALRSCLAGEHPELAAAVQGDLLACVETLYFSPVFSAPEGPALYWPKAKEMSGARWIFPVAPLSRNEPPFPSGAELPAGSFDGGVEHHYAYALLSWAWELAEPESKARYMKRMLELGPRYRNWHDLSEHLARQSWNHPGFDPLMQAAPALAIGLR